MEKKRTLVLGASPKPERFSYAAVVKLLKNEFPVIAVGLREGEIKGIRIEKPFPEYADIDTIALYVGPKNQSVYYEYILKLRPRRVIFNPGTENEEFERVLKENAVEVVRDCTLVMLSRGNY
jgi:uncharacterized protein